MKYLLAFSVALFTLAASADNRPVNGYGDHSGFCYEYDAYFCLDNLKRGSREKAVRDAEWTCRVSYQGVVDTYSAYCTDFCNPSFFYQGQQFPVYASCRSNCSLRCEIPAPAPEVAE
jgi:hypothetical protein